MVAVSAPFGLRAVYHPSGLIRPRSLDAGIASGYANNLFSGQAILMTTGGTIDTVAATNVDFIGAFAGIEYTPAGGRPVIANFWPANTVLQSGTTARVWFYEDPEILYEIQCDGSLAQTSVYDGAGLSNFANGSTLTGLSAATMSSALAGAGNPAQLQVVDLYPDINNAWGDAFTVVRVRIARHQWISNKNMI